MSDYEWTPAASRAPHRRTWWQLAGEETFTAPQMAELTAALSFVDVYDAEVGSAATGSQVRLYVCTITASVRVFIYASCIASVTEFMHHV